MIWAVLDTNVLVSGLGWRRGIPARIVDAAISGRFVLVASETLLDELARVVRYTKLRKAFPNPRETVDMLREASLIISAGISLSVLADDNDNRVLEAAITARAEAIVTGDADILSLAPAWQGIRIVTPAEFLTLLESAAGP